MAMQLGSSGVKSDINVTPFVDIVLVLLIIFMVVTPMLSRALDLSVPPKSDAQTATEEIGAEQLIISIKGPDTQPKIYLNREEIAGGPEGVKDRVSELMKGRKDKIVFFTADSEIPYQFAVEVMDNIRGGGAEKIGLITDENLDVLAAPAQ